MKKTKLKNLKLGTIFRLEENGTEYRRLRAYDGKIAGFIFKCIFTGYVRPFGSVDYFDYDQIVFVED